MRTKYTAERDSIKVKESGVIWNKDSIGYLALFSPAIICLVLSLIFGILNIPILLLSIIGGLCQITGLLLDWMKIEAITAGPKQCVSNLM
jgi:hypothetical protein